MRLTGWRRLGIVITAVWLLGAAALLWGGPTQVLRVFPGLGTQDFATSSIPAPELRTGLEAAKSRKLGRDLLPWEKEWNPVRVVSVPSEATLPHATRWFILFGLPAIYWIFTEILALIFGWVKAGFHLNKS